MEKKKFSLLLTIILFVVVVAGVIIFLFTKNVTVSDKSKVVNIKHWVWLDNPNDPTYKDMIDEFNSTHPGIHVEMELIAWKDMRTKLLTAAVGGGLPDSSGFKLSWVPEFVGSDALEPLDSYIDSWPGKSDIVDNLWDVFSVTNDNKHYAMPWEVQVQYVYYRPSLFKEAGVEIPKTWDEFVDVAKKLTVDKNGDGIIDQYGFGLRGGRYGHESWMGFVFSGVAGDHKLMSDDGKALFYTPDVVAANQLYLDLYRKYNAVPRTAPMDSFAEIIANFKSGKTAMTIHHSKSSKDMIEAFGDDVAVFPMPAGKYGNWTLLTDTTNVVYKSSKNKKEAFTFISWLSEKEQNDRWCRVIANVPICKSVQELDYYRNNRFMKVSFESLSFARMSPICEAMGEWAEVLWPATTQQALEGKISSDEMIKTLAEGLE